MFDSQYNLKLIDFGLSNKIAGYKQRSLSGTPGYMAPEIYTRTI